VRLSGRVALITGAGSGIGRAAATLFAAEGAAVVVADISDEHGQATVDRIISGGGRALFQRTDVGEPSSVEAAVERAVSAFGGLSILYNNAGGTSPEDGSVTSASLEAFEKAIRIDLLGTWLVCRYGIPVLVRGGGGTIVNSSSMMALTGRGKHAYTAAKGGVAALTRALAVEYAPQKIRVNAVAPGVVMTERVARRHAAGALPVGLLDRHLHGALAPEDVARTALFLASDDAAGITGQVVQVDSGATVS
jgi:NAD(P)-dependent dehydrogenase (short-subunit alcohol dehydrogenase family)